MKCTTPSSVCFRSPPNTAQSYPPLALQLPVANPICFVPVAPVTPFTAHAYDVGSEFENIDVSPLSLAPPNAHRVVVAPPALQSAHVPSRPGKKFKPCTRTDASLCANTALGNTAAANGG